MLRSEAWPSPPPPGHSRGRLTGRRMPPPGTTTGPRRLCRSRAHGWWKTSARSIAQSFRSKLIAFPLESTVAFRPEVSLTPYLSGTSFLAFLTAF